MSDGDSVASRDAVTLGEPDLEDESFDFVRLELFVGPDCEGVSLGVGDSVRLGLTVVVLLGPDREEDLEILKSSVALPREVLPVRDIVCELEPNVLVSSLVADVELDVVREYVEL